ncbi:hypothetical protein ABDD95_11075 [Mucilaginibacter sp. PAMB04274]|uniref:hypothetical protein n=1 Tax=Mucilaginibacter sp. PAMB04274 TaxID=3138568 RepID=UPI0031F6FB9B
MKRLLYIVPLILLAACGKRESSTTPSEIIIPPPSKPVLVTPAQNQVCTQGTVISASQSTVNFKWDAAANADSYELTLKNLLTGVVITQTTLLPQTDVILSRNTPFSWSVTAKSAKASLIAQSDIWKFYNAGSGTTNYAPFPAEIISPALGQTVNAVNSKISLTWKGTDADNDISYYDVYLSTTAVPALLQSGVAPMSLTNVNVTANSTYYWKIITYDAQGNSSDSGVYSFKVN